MKLSAGDREWLRVRGYLQEQRFTLGLAAGRDLYPDTARVAGTPLLTAPRWMPDRPVPLDAVALELVDAPVPPRLPGPRYSDLIARLAHPAVFEDRPTYRLLEATLDGDRPRMRFGTGSYFDGVDTGEAAAHEFAAADLAAHPAPTPSPAPPPTPPPAPHPARTSGTFGQADCSKGPFVREGGATGAGVPAGGGVRDAIGDPVDPARRPVNVAISAITLRDGDPPRFLAHRRDPARVAHAGGLLQVVPVGVFQPVSPDTARHDFSLWRCLQREFAEELLGEPEPTGRVDYAAFPFDRDRMRAHVLGMGIDPLTLATDVLVAVVADDGLLSRRVAANDEGTVSEHPFTADVVDHFLHREPMQAAGAAALALAWRHRAQLLSRTPSTPRAPASPAR